MKRIVIVRSNNVDPDSRVEKEANSLALAGHNVTLLTWNRGANYMIKEEKIRLQDTSVTRVSFGAKATFGEGIKNIIPYLKFQYRIFIWLVKNKKSFDICHFCDFDTANVGSISCRLIRKKYVFDIFDYLSTDANTFFQKLIKKREEYIINHADATIICTEQRKEQIAGCEPHNLTVIHNSPASVPLIKDISKNKKKERVRIAYVGILMEGRLLKEMVHEISKMSDVELHIGGFGKYEAFMEEQSSKYDNIVYYGKLSYDKTLALENECDLMTAIYDPQIGNHRYAAPNKFYEALFLGKPLIMVDGTGMSNVVEQEDIGTLIEYSSYGFQSGVRRLIDRKSDWEQMSKRMKQLYTEYYSWTKMEQRLVQLYDKLSM